jgi:MFS family permease
MFASCVAVLLGYDIGVMSGAILGIESSLNLTTAEVELVIGSLNFVSAFGSLFVAGFSDRVGRRFCLFVAMVLSTIGTIMMTVANDFWMMLGGRMVCGLGVGCGERAPKYRLDVIHFLRPSFPQAWRQSPYSSQR